IVRRRRAVHERYGTDGRLAHGTAGYGESGRGANRHAPDAGDLHEEIVRVLTIDQRTSVDDFARLEYLPITRLADSGGIEAQHRVEREPGRTGLPARHAHPPVRHLELVAASRAALMIEQPEDDPILHELPARGF